MQPKLKGSPRSSEYSHIAEDHLLRRRKKAAREAPSTLVPTRRRASSDPKVASSRPVYARRYQLEDRIGRGGMAEVWAAYDRSRLERVALKIINLDCEDPARARARFEREASLSRELCGRPFVDVFDHGVVDSTAFIAMTLLEGETLHERLRRRRRLSSAECRVMLDGIAEGLRLAHALQIVHRDLKPGNIFFARRTPKSSGSRSLRELDEVVKLLDFGIAKDGWDRSNLTRPGMVLGSASYMSPEHIECGPDIDVRADLWSLAVVLYRALTGQLPFAGGLAAAVVAIQTQDPRPATQVNPALVASADGFFERAFRKDRDLRFQTIDELVRAFYAAFPMPDDTAAEATKPPFAEAAFSDFESIDIGSFDGSESATLDAATSAPSGDRPLPQWRSSAASVESITVEQRTERKESRLPPPPRLPSPAIAAKPTGRKPPPPRVGSLPPFRRSGASVVPVRDAAPANILAPPSRWRSFALPLVIVSVVTCVALLVYRDYSVRVFSALLRILGLG